MNSIVTCEFVSPLHPDKICDQIADAIVDTCLEGDPQSRVAVEVLGGHGTITLSGEITTESHLVIEDIVRTIVHEPVSIVSHMSQQSPEIARGVDDGGAGDQGIMVGYATAATPRMMPLEYEVVRTLCQKVFAHYPYDGKAQVTMRDGSIESVVVSFQNAPTDKLDALVRSLVDAETYWINPAGPWSIGGFAADSGATGRKLVIDNYGPQISIGGGAFSGKDATKVDRSAAYMARRIACDYIRRGADQALVKIAYAIGQAQPVMATAIVDGTWYRITDYDLRPQATIEALQLQRPQFLATARSGHFGHQNLWD